MIVGGKAAKDTLALVDLRIAGDTFVPVGMWGSKRGAARRARRSAAAGAEHRRRRLVVAADWAITAAGRRVLAEGAGVAVTVADVIERAADDGLVVTRSAAAEVLRERFTVRGGGIGLTTDAFDVPGRAG